MRQSTSFRFMRSATGQLLFVLTLMFLLVLGGQVVKAAPVAATTSAHHGTFGFGKAKNNSGIARTPWRASRTVKHRKGLFGWLKPKQTPQVRAAKYRAAHRANLHGRNGRKVTPWHRMRG